MFPLTLLDRLHTEVLVKRLMVTLTVLLTLAAPVRAEDLTIDLHYEPTANTEPPQGLFSVVKLLRPVKIAPFIDKRSVADTYVGNLRVAGQAKRLLSKTALSLYVSDVFRKVYGEWGGKSSADDLLLLKGEITQFRIEEADGYQARVGFHFYLHDDSGKILWDGHSSGIVRGSGRTLTPESLSTVLSDILRATFAELLEDDKLIGVWSGKVSNTYVVRDGEVTAAARAAGNR